MGNICYVGLELFYGNFRGVISKVFNDYDEMKDYLLSIGYYEDSEYRFVSFYNVDALIIVQSKIYVD